MMGRKLPPTIPPGLASLGPEPLAPVQASHRPLIRVDRLSKLFPVDRGWFGKPRFVHAVDSVSLYLRHGETFALVGESGCGKSTLGRTILRLIEPTYGRIVFEEQDLTPLSQRQLRPFRRYMQIVFQDPNASLDPRMTALEIVGEGLRIHNLVSSESNLQQRVAELLDQVGMPADSMHRYPHEFSAGQRQRIAVARAIAVEPSFIVCDEPVSSLDVSVQAQIVNLLSDLQKTAGISYLFISHDLRLVRHLAQRVAVMYLGRLVEVGPVEDVFAEPLHPYTRALLSAVPVPDPSRKRLRIMLEGELPNPIDPPPGCPFHPRCPKADDQMCRLDLPPLVEFAAGSHHRAACWHPERNVKG